MGRAREGLRDLADRTPLRVKLITVVLALVAMALAVISVISISVLTRDLLGQADNQISTLWHQAQRGHANENVLGPEQWEFLGVIGNSAPQNAGGSFTLTSTPNLSPADVAWLTANPSQPMTVAGQPGGKWRVAAYLNYQGFVNQQTGQTFTGTLIIGVDVTSTYGTLGQAVLIDVIVSVALLLLLMIVGIAVIRASLRPLTDIERTAGAIAAGDLTRRVPDADPRTEVGRLGGSLNAMLSQIEAAFDARAESEYAARRSEERMRQFVADASHELRTPLTAIRGFAEYYRQRGGTAGAGGAAELPGGPASHRALANGTEDSGTGADLADAGSAPAPRHGSNAESDRRGPLARNELDRIMRRVEQESSRMGVLVEDMLLLARLDQQRPLEQSTVDMLTLAADAVHDARVVAPDRSINLTVGAGAALLVLGDEVRLRQVIGNLMSNALNHTPDGTGIEVRVRLGSLDEWRGAAAAANATGRSVAVAVPDIQPFPAVVFEIADQGPGLTPTQAEHVFERFYRADQARTRPGGTGLGLAIVAALIAAHGGTVWVESSPGNGAIFRIALPLAPEARQSGPEATDWTDPDILDSHRPLMQWPEVPPAPPEPSAPPTGQAESATAAPLPKRRPGFSGHIPT